jgi:hypothetical protein
MNVYLVTYRMRGSKTRHRRTVYGRNVDEAERSFVCEMARYGCEPFKYAITSIREIHLLEPVT